MSKKSCPNCGIQVPGTAENCSCGFTFVEYDDLPAPGVIRGGGNLEAAMAAQPIEEPPEPSRPASPPSATSRGAGKSTSPPARGAGHRKGGMLMSCPSCDARISKRAEKCPKCGSAPFSECLICFASIVADSAACPECGDPDPFGG